MSHRFPVHLVTLASVLVWFTACYGSPLGECPPDSDAEQSAGAQIIADRCQDCHASTRTGAERQGAPPDLNFDDLEVVRNQAERMYGQASEGKMPPGDPLGDDQIEALRVYLACGAEATP